MLESKNSLLSTTVQLLVQKEGHIELGLLIE